MGLIYCRFCGHQMSDQALNCPNCGANVGLNPMQNNRQQPYPHPSQQADNTKKLLYVIIGLLVVLLLGILAYILLSKNSEKEEKINELEQKQEVLEKKNEELQSKVDKANAQVGVATASNPASGSFFLGTIGGDYGAYLSMPYGGGMGTYKFVDYTRNIQFTSYDPNTRSLILSAYEEGTGKYIGKFVGTLTRQGHGYGYKGVFTNYKGGKVNFNLVEHND